MQAENEARNSGNNERSKVLVPMYSDMCVFSLVFIQICQSRFLSRFVSYMFCTFISQYMLDVEFWY